MMKNDIDKLIAESIETAQKYLPKLYNGLDKCVNHIENEEIEEALNILENALDGIKWLHIILTSIEKWPIGTIEQSNVEDLRQRLDDAVKQLLQGMENKDFLLIADIINYDLLNIIDIFYKMLFGKLETEDNCYGV